MHPILQQIDSELQKNKTDAELRYKFALRCIEEVASNLEEDRAIESFQKFKSCVNSFSDQSIETLNHLATDLKKIAQSHPGSKSIDGTKHAAVSATYALAKAVEGDAVQAAAYAAYSSLYGYGGYAVKDPEAFAEVHEKQLRYLSQLISAQTP